MPIYGPGQPGGSSYPGGPTSGRYTRAAPATTERWPGVPTYTPKSTGPGGETTDAGAFDPGAFGMSVAQGDMDPRMAWSQVAGLWFRSGTYRPPTESRNGEALTPYRGSQWVRPSTILASLNAIPQETLMQIQYRLWEAGFYERAPSGGEGARPEWGRVDLTTREAYMAFFAYAAERPENTLEQSLNEAARNRLAMLPSLTPEERAAAGLPGAEADFHPQITSNETLDALIDDIAQELNGRFIDGDRKNQMISELQGKQSALEYQRHQYDITAKGVGVPGGAPELERFMAALSGQESQGDYNAVNADSGAAGRWQIMPNNWPKWAMRAGLSSTAPMTPANQDRVVRVVLSDYYRQFGNWRDVAIAWYAGGIDQKPGARDRRQGGGRYPSINQYANEVLSRFNMAQSSGGAGSAQFPMGAPTENFDAAAEVRAAAKAADPKGWGTNQWASRAADFFSLLSSPVEVES